MRPLDTLDNAWRETADGSTLTLGYGMVEKRTSINYYP